MVAVDDGGRSAALRRLWMAVVWSAAQRRRSGQRHSAGHEHGGSLGRNTVALWLWFLTTILTWQLKPDKNLTETVEGCIPDGFHSIGVEVRIVGCNVTFKTSLGGLIWTPLPFP
jgi:hypothetical protein